MNSAVQNCGERGKVNSNNDGKAAVDKLNENMQRSPTDFDTNKHGQLTKTKDDQV